MNRKRGLYKPKNDFNKYLYEIQGHLGNVRAVVGEDEVTLEYLATMESERSEKEDAYFEKIKRSATADFINHTP